MLLKNFYWYRKTLKVCCYVKKKDEPRYYNNIQNIHRTRKKETKILILSLLGMELGGSFFLTLFCIFQISIGGCTTFLVG